MNSGNAFWIVSVVLGIVGCLLFYSIVIYNSPPVAYVERVDKNGTVWIKLNNLSVSENATIYLYYGDKVNSKASWILKAK